MVTGIKWWEKETPTLVNLFFWGHIIPKLVTLKFLGNLWRTLTLALDTLCNIYKKITNLDCHDKSSWESLSKSNNPIRQLNIFNSKCSKIYTTNHI